MNEVESFAPGKLFVIGEYAVLDGAKALVVAVDSGISCRAVATASGWRLRAPDLGVDLDLDEACPKGAATLLVAAVDTARRRFRPTGALDLLVRASDSASGVGAAKRGLGGSAASVVAVIGAVAAAAGHSLDDPELRGQIFEAALAVQRSVQGRRASGGDVAASVYGGWLAYRPIGEGAEIESIPPIGRLLAAWTGRSASTPDAILEYDRFAASAEGELWRRRAEATLGDFWGAQARSDAADCDRALAAYGELLRELLTGEDPARTLVEVAQSRGVVAKSSGAVGGDSVLAIARDESAVAALSADWRQAGAAVIDLRVDDRGLRNRIEVGAAA